MKYLPDTHAVIWLLESPEKIPARTLAALSDSSNQVFLSPVVTWEIGIKAKLGKLKLKVAIAELARFCIEEYRFEEMPITVAHTTAVARLANLHKDPFDRLLVAQAMTEKLRIVTDDTMIRSYKVATVW